MCQARNCPSPPLTSPTCLGDNTGGTSRAKPVYNPNQEGGLGPLFGVHYLQPMANPSQYIGLTGQTQAHTQTPVGDVFLVGVPQYCGYWYAGGTSTIASRIPTSEWLTDEDTRKWLQALATADSQQFRVHADDVLSVILGQQFQSWPFRNGMAPFNWAFLRFQVTVGLQPYDCGVLCYRKFTTPPAGTGSDISAKDRWTNLDLSGIEFPRATLIWRGAKLELPAVAPPWPLCPFSPVNPIGTENRRHLKLPYRWHTSRQVRTL